MAGRFVIQKIASGMSRRSRTFFLPHDASVRAGAPVSVTAPEGGIRTLSHLFHGAAVHPSPDVPNKLVPNIHVLGIHGHDARNACSHVSAKTSYISTGTLSTIVKHMKPGFACSVRGVKQTFPSNMCTEREASRRAEIAAWQAQWDAFDAKMAEKDVKFQKFIRTQIWFFGFSCFSCLLGFFLDEVLHRRKYITDKFHTGEVAPGT
ncbi:hypothetical protein BS78_01G028000 [Paspalum vaginatum]|nr:hypothetical protein BS78_01G028000 [Paspalum vaginatum]